ncbi:hypothetical protein [Marinobacter sp.]|uniref:hypothetical protein n=1 Tax=Marinobacter sp. TaxID=50741 RepID=UPI0038504FF0
MAKQATAVISPGNGILFLLLIAIALPGCSNRLVPPQQMQAPVTVHILDHGRHPSLVLPEPEGDWVRYVHGEWRWYAEHKTGIWRAFEALFWPTRAAVGRGHLTRLPESGGLSAEIPEGFVSRYSFSVERKEMAKLRSNLEQHFERASQTFHQPRYNLDFVPYPHPYTVLNNSNHVMSQWLRDMGIEVHGTALFSQWQIGPETCDP